MEFILMFLLITVNVCAYHHEGDYWVKLERSVLVFYNKNYSNPPIYTMTFYNRTQKLINWDFTLIRDCNDIKINYQVFKFMSNEYRFFPVTMNLDFCTEYKKNTFGLQDMLNKYSNIRPCNLKKGHYYLRNAVQDFSALPPLLPGGMYKVKEEYKAGHELMFELNGFYTVTEFLKKWEN